jgi:hypothetical protein
MRLQDRLCGLFLLQCFGTDSDAGTQFLANVVNRCLNSKWAIFGEQTEMHFANDDFRTKAVFQHERTRSLVCSTALSS